MKRCVDLASLRQWVLSSLTLTLLCNIFAQDIAMGTWRTHFSYANAKHLAVTADKIFCATEIGFFSREINSGNTRKLSKIDGLADVGVSALSFNPNQNVLVIGYRSGFVDFVFEDRITTISDLARSTLDVDKTINSIAYTASRTYLATDLGVIVIKTEEAEVSENFIQIGAGGEEVEVLEILEKDNTLIIRTNEGVQSGSLDQNLLDFNNWTRHIGSNQYKNLTLAENRVFATFEGNLLELKSNWEDTGIDLPNLATKLFSSEGALMTADTDGAIYQLEANTFQIVANTQSNEINDLLNISGEFFIADGANGLQDQDGNSLSPDGPIQDVFSNIRVVNNEFYGFHAPSPFSYNGSQQQTSFSLFADGLWKSKSISGFTNVSDVAAFNGSRYFSSIGDGLYDEMNDEIITDIPQSSSSLDTMIAALKSDEMLWVSSFGNQHPIHLLDQGGEWSSFNSTQLFDNEFIIIDVSEFGVGWLGSSSGTITVFDPMENNADIISTADGLPSAFIDFDISVEDNVWVGTSKGPAVFESASFIFLLSAALRPSFEGRTLFEDEHVNAVMTDGGNRIWFGTNSGVWVYDENTSEQVAVYTEANSPLPSNKIIQLEYNGRNGEVYILTEMGLVSYRSSSSIGNQAHRNVNIFPNPVRPNYQGLVGLTGLARNVNIKVTDVSGNLVAELEANGGSASWNLTSINGSRINTGVYLFFSATSDGEETYVGKIAVIR